METFISRDAAERCGVTIQKFHRLAAAHRIEPVMKAPGTYGAKFWLSRDIDRLLELIEEGAA